MAPPRCDDRIAKLIVRLHDTDEKLSFGKIAEHVGMAKSSVALIYQREKKPVALKKGGKQRVTDKRYLLYCCCAFTAFYYRTDRKIARLSKENPRLTAPEIREELKLENVSPATMRRRLNEVIFICILHFFWQLGRVVWTSPSRKTMDFSKECEQALKFR